MPPRNFGNRNPGIQCLNDDPPLLLRRPPPAASHSGAYLHPPKRDLRVAYSVGHMCKTFPPNKREVCLVARASIKVVSENRLRFIDYYAHIKATELARFAADGGGEGDVTAWEHNKYFDMF